MSKNLFSKSLNNKPSLLKNMAKDKMKSHGFTNSTERLETIFEFYSPDIRKSKKLSDEEKFTNFIHDRTTSTQIKTRLYELAQDPSIVDSPKAGEVKLTDKVKKCIQLYVSDFNEDKIVFKSDLLDTFDSELGFRVYCIMDLPDDNPEMKAVFKIVLIDPFHLVIPSRHNGKSKEVVENEVYNFNWHNRLCIDDYLRDLM